MSVFKKAEYSQVEGQTGLIRDNHSKAIISTDVFALQEHRKQKDAMMKRINIIKSLNDQYIDKINILEGHVSELKNLVYKLIENKE